MAEKVREDRKMYPKMINLTLSGEKISTISKRREKLKLCLHVTFAFACAFDANYGCHNTKWRCLHSRLRLRQHVRAMQRMGWEPIFDVCVWVKLHSCNGYQVESAAFSMYFALYRLKMSSASC